MAFQFTEGLSILLRLLASYALALPIGWERERHERTAGLRTFPLVAVASCGYVLVGLQVFGPNPEAQARIIQGLMTGIGFIGGGAILKREEMVRGTAAAAGIWATGAVGAAAAYGNFGIGLLISIITYGTLRWMTPVKERIEKESERRRPES